MYQLNIYLTNIEWYILILNNHESMFDGYKVNINEIPHIKYK